MLSCWSLLHRLVPSRVSRYLNYLSIECSFIQFVVLAHPIHVIESQSIALGIPHKILFVEAPFLNSYQQRIKELHNEFNVEILLTGKYIHDI